MPKPPFDPAMSDPLPTVGVLVDTLDEEYQQGVVAGLCEEAAALGLAVHCFVGGGLNSPHRASRQQNAAYNLCRAESLCAAVVMTGTLANYGDAGALEALANRLNAVPLCSIGGTLPGALRVEVSIREGLREAIGQLVTVRGKRRIGFIKGPESNPEAQARFAVFTELMREFQLNSDIVVEGDFLETSGARAVETLLDTRRQAFDALIAANDLMALGALRALAARGVAVPERVAVVGFDDIRAARFSTPTLSTVRQPLYEQGRRALQEVVARVSQADLPETSSLHATFVPRESCGARTLTSFLEGTGSATLGAGPDEQRVGEAFIRGQSALVAHIRALLERSGLSPDSNLAERLVLHATAEIQGLEKGLLQSQTFLGFLEEGVRQTDVTLVDSDVWQALVSLMRGHFAAYLQQEPRWQRAADDLWHQARVMLGRLAERGQARRWLKLDARLGQVKRAHELILDADSLPALLSVLREAFKGLEVHRCLVAITGEPGTYRGLFAMDAESVLTDFEEPLIPGQWLPQRWARLDDAGPWIVQALAWRGTTLGFFAVQGDPRQGRTLAVIRDALSTWVMSQRSLSAETPS